MSIFADTRSKQLGPSVQAQAQVGLSPSRQAFESGAAAGRLEQGGWSYITLTRNLNFPAEQLLYLGKNGHFKLPAR